MGLRDRINNPDRKWYGSHPNHPVGSCDRCQPERRKQPRWIERKNEQGLPAKDMTSLGTAA